MRNSTYMNTYKRIVFLFSIVFVLARPVSIVADDYLQWSKSVNCTLNTTSTGANIAGNVTNFPILLRLNAGNFNFAEVQTNGADIRFAKSDGTHLNYQIERCDVSAGFADIWVKVDTVRGNNNSQSIKMFWGKIAAPDSSRPASVFDTAEGWRGVWHFNGTGDLTDNTVRHLVDTNHSTTTGVGNIGTGISIAQGKWIGVPPSLMAGIDSNITVSFWNYGNSTGLPKSDDRIDIIKTQGTQWYNGFGWRIMQDTTINCYWGDANGATFVNYKPTSTTQWKGQWNHWALRRSPGNWWLLINGAQVATGTTNRSMVGNSVNRVEIGTSDNGADYSYRGNLDELRFARANRSSDWVKLEYENQKLNQTVVRLGSPSSLAVDNYTTWSYSQNCTLNTTGSGANVANNVRNFPILIRLNGGNFNFNQLSDQVSGKDLRFAKSDGTHLSYQIERCDPGTPDSAEIWVKLDTVRGNNSSQYIKMYWGKSGAGDSSRPKMVFDTANAYKGVWHFNASTDTIDVSYNQLKARPSSATPQQRPVFSRGIVGPRAVEIAAWNYVAFPSNALVGADSQVTVSFWACGDSITMDKKSGGRHDRTEILESAPYPNGLDMSLTTSDTMVSWRTGGADGSDYCTTPMVTDSLDYKMRWNLWTMTKHSASGRMRVYENGLLRYAATGKTKKINTTIDSLCLGDWGWDYSFRGRIDEFRIAKTERDSNWIKLEYENQKAAQTLVQSETNNPFANWLYSKKYYLNTTITGANIAADVANFPLAIRLDAATFSFMQAKVDGSDLRFADANNNELPYQIEEWNDAAGQALVWVKVPLVKGNSTENTLTMYWGNFEAAARTSATAVFETANNFAAVYHFGSANTFNDATANNNNGANFGSSATTGVLGSCRSFNGQSNVRVADNATLEPANLTISCWFKRSGEQTNWSKIVDKGNPDFPFPSYTLEMRDATDKAGYQTAHTDNNFNSVNTNNEIVDNSWYLLTGTYNSTTGKGELFLNGRSCGTFTNANPVEYYNTAAWDLYIGSQSGNDAGFKGLIDEVVIANTVRSPEWIKLCYLTQNPNQKLVSNQSGVQELSFGITSPNRITPFGLSGSSWTEDCSPGSTDPIVMAGVTYTSGIGSQSPVQANTYSWALYNLKTAVEELGINGLPLAISGFGGKQDGSGNLELTIRTAAGQTNPTQSDWENLQNGVVEQWHYSSDEPSNKPIAIDVATEQWVWIGVKSSQQSLPAAGVFGKLSLKVNTIVEDMTKWGFYRLLNLRPATTVDETAYNVPVAIQLTKSNFEFAQANADGSDLRFTDANGNPLPYEIEHWTPNPGGDIWVLVPKIIAGATAADKTNQIIMYWGNSEAQSLSNSEVVFTAEDGYIAVWHMIEDPKVEPIKDATKFHHDARIPNPANVARVPGMVRDGIALQNHLGYLDADAFDVGSMPGSATTASSAISLEAWFKADGFGALNRIITRSENLYSPNPKEYWILFTKSVDGTIRLCFRILLNNTLYEVISNNTAPVIEPGKWVYAVASYNGTTINLYINGAPAGSLSASGIITTSFDAHVYIGAKKYESAQFRGVLDEVRIAGVARTASWVMNAYTNFSTLIGNMSAYTISTQVAYFGDYVVERSNYVEEEYVEQSYETFAEGRIVTDANGNISPSFYITDHLGSTRAVITPDNGGTLVEAIAYSSYGNMHLLVTPAEKTREKFTTKEFDEDGNVNGAGGIRLNYFPARYYDAEIGRWTACDPSNQFWSAYSYAGNGSNPVGAIDPNGKWLGWINQQDRSHHAGEAVTYNDFLAANQGKSLADLTNATGPKSQGAGPTPRYVKDPANLSDVIDMRHFIVVGQQGEAAGLAVELIQMSGADKTSGGDGQDFFSNELGAKMLGSQNTKIPFMDRLKAFFQVRELGSVPTPNQTGSTPSDATRVKVGG